MLSLTFSILFANKIVQITTYLLVLISSIIIFNAQFKDTKKQALLLKEYYEKARNSVEEEKPIYEKLFFDAFPSTFKEMEELFGFDDVKGAAPLYNDVGGKILIFFGNLKYIEKNKYYNKYISICIGGNFQADYISEGFGITSKFNSDTKIIISILSKYTDAEIRSVFRFIFDGREPMIWTDYSQKLYNKINKIDSRVAKLMKESFNKLFEEDKHSH